MTTPDQIMREFCESVAAVRAGHPDPHPYPDRTTGPWGDDSSFEQPEGLQWSPEQWETYEDRARDGYAGNWRAA